MPVATTFSTKAGFLLMIACTIFTSLGQLLWKAGSLRIDLSAPLTILNLPFLLGFVSYGMGAVLMIAAFKSGELSLLYPLMASSYVWVSMVASYFFPGDSMNVLKWIGIFLILFSVSILGWSSSRRKAQE